MAGPLKGGGGLKGRAIKKKKKFFTLFFVQRSNFPTAIKLEGRGQALMARPLRQDFFLRLL